MNIDTAYFSPRIYTAADPLCFGAAAGLGIGIFFGRPVVGCLTGVSICYGYETIAPGSSFNLNNSDSGGMPEQQFMVRTAEISESTYLSPDQHSDGEELTDVGRSCRRALPYVRPHRSLPKGGVGSRWCVGLWLK